jgi:hypothetical protein
MDRPAALVLGSFPSVSLHTPENTVMARVQTALLSLLIALCGLSCSQPPEEARVATDEELLQLWLQAAEKPDIDIATASAIAGQLIQRNPQNINLFFQVLADHDSPARAKLQAMLCLLPFVTPDMASQLVELTEPSFETTTRTCATHMLASLDSPAARARLQELKDDENDRVRMTAKLALLISMDPGVLDEVETMWADPKTTVADRDQMLLVLIGHDAERFMPLYEEAVNLPDIDEQARLRTVEYLGRKGEASSAVALRKLIETPGTQDSLRQLAESAIAAIESRLANPAAAPAETGIDATAPASEAGVPAPSAAPGEEPAPAEPAA